MNTIIVCLLCALFVQKMPDTLTYKDPDTDEISTWDKKDIYLAKDTIYVIAHTKNMRVAPEEGGRKNVYWAVAYSLKDSSKNEFNYFTPYVNNWETKKEAFDEIKKSAPIVAGEFYKKKKDKYTDFIFYHAARLREKQSSQSKNKK